MKKLKAPEAARHLYLFFRDMLGPEVQRRFVGAFAQLAAVLDPAQAESINREFNKIIKKTEEVENEKEK